MNINIVYPGPGHPRLSPILPRLAELLSKETGWALSTEPDDSADLNYFFPYLVLRDFEYYHKTMTAAWFTHREEVVATKECTWDKAARVVDLRLTPTDLYAEQLEPFGRTSLTTPPIDPIFRPFDVPKRSDQQTIGISGFVYKKSGRKGEALIEALLKSRIMNERTLRAVGRGWPTECELLNFESLPNFYNSIDIYLCPSSVEGPGYGPLEALACGTKIVIPMGVGIFDELPHCPGIVRYVREDYADMERAILKALDEEHDPQELIDSVCFYTAEAWTADHEHAIRKALYPVEPIPEILPAWTPENAGVYMVAYGTPARECAEKAINSWHKFMEIPVALVSDEPLGPEDIFIQQADRDLAGRSIKTDIWDLSPEQWQYIIYVDADTELIADVRFLLDLLVDGWELSIAYNPEEFSLGRKMARPDNQDECQETFELIGTDEFLQMNGGVFSFRRCTRTERFFRYWHSEWDRWGKRDQAAFDRALYTFPLRVFTLGSEWNTITRYMDAERSAGILHYPTLARRWSGIIHERLDSPGAWKEAGLK